MNLAVMMLSEISQSEKDKYWYDSTSKKCLRKSHPQRDRKNGSEGTENCCSLGRVSTWDDENVLRMGSGQSCTTT